MLPLTRATAERATVPGWVAELRSEGLDHFEKLAMPSPSEEAWRYIDLDFDLDDLVLAAEPGPPLAEPDVLGDALGATAGRMTVVDGAVVSEPESASNLGSIAGAVVAHESLIRGALGRGIPVDLDRFSAAHHAFGTDGAFLYVPAGTAVTEPFYVDIQAVTAGTVSFPRVTVVVEDNAQAALVVNLRSPGDAPVTVVPQLEISVRDNAHLAVSVVQNFGYRTNAIAHARVVVGRDASIRFAEAGLGAALGRLHLTADMMGRGSSATIVGTYFGEERQTLDYRYFVNHIGVHTSSEMFLKGAVEDEALSVFTGMIRIEEGAQRTDAFQTNRNLILSEGATAQSVPNLEILANDVRCGHGSTMGPLDPEQRYYLMSRGLSRSRADRLQVHGFFEEALARFPDARVAGPVRDWINAKYVTAQEEGRV